MRFSFSALALVAAPMIALAQAQTINTPTGVTFCLPSLLTWSGGMAPYTVTIIPGGQPNGAVIETLVTASTATTYTWIADIAAGTSITFALRDSMGNIVYSAPVTVAAGVGTTCGSASANSASINTSATVVAGNSASAAVSSATGSVSRAASSAVGVASSGVSSAASAATGVVSSVAGAASSRVSQITGGVASASSIAASIASAAASVTARSGAETIKVGGLAVAAVAVFAGVLAL